MRRQLQRSVLPAVILLAGCSSISRHTYFSPEAESALLSNRVKDDIDFHLSGPPDMATLEIHGTEVRVAVASFRPTMVFWGPIPLPVIPVFPVSLFRERHFRVGRFDRQHNDSSLVVIAELAPDPPADLEELLAAATLSDVTSGQVVACSALRSPRGYWEGRIVREMEFPVPPGSLKEVRLRIGDRELRFRRSAGWRFESEVD